MACGHRVTLELGSAVGVGDVELDVAAPGAVSGALIAQDGGAGLRGVGDQQVDAGDVGAILEQEGRAATNLHLAAGTAHTQGLRVTGDDAALLADVNVATDLVDGVQIEIVAACLHQAVGIDDAGTHEGVVAGDDLIPVGGVAVEVVPDGVGIDDGDVPRHVERAAADDDLHVGGVGLYEAVEVDQTGFEGQGRAVLQDQVVLGGGGHGLAGGGGVEADRQRVDRRVGRDLARGIIVFVTRVAAGG